MQFRNSLMLTGALVIGGAIAYGITNGMENDRVLYPSFAGVAVGGAIFSLGMAIPRYRIDRPERPTVEYRRDL